MKQRTPGQTKQRLTKKSKPAPVKPFSEHIGELRRRFFAIALAFIVASVLAYNFNDQLIEAIMRPLGGEKLVYLTPGGGFNFIFQISMYAGLIAAAPMVIYQLYGFIRPALPARAQRSAVAVVLVAFLLMLCGVAFGYFIAIPSALHFLSTFAGTNIIPNLTADSYLSFFLAYIAGLGVLFELPLLLLFLHWIHPLTPKGLMKSERFVVLFSFIAAALITPTPDVYNQGMIALPLIFIYQLGVIVVWLTIRKEHKKTNLNLTPKPSPLKEASIEISPQPTPPQLAPVPVPVEAPTPPPVLRRSMDGFTRPNRLQTPIPQRPSPPLHLQQRPSSPIKNDRRRLSVDGFSVG